MLYKYKSINTEFEKSVERNLKEEDEKTKIRREKIADMMSMQFLEMRILKMTQIVVPNYDKKIFTFDGTKF